MGAQADQAREQPVRAEEILAAQRAALSKIGQRQQDPFQEMNANAETMVRAMNQASDEENAASQLAVSKDEPARGTISAAKRRTTSKIESAASDSQQLDEDTYSSSKYDAEKISSAKFTLALRTACTMLYALNVVLATSPVAGVLWAVGGACWGLLAIGTLCDLMDLHAGKEVETKPARRLDD